MQRLNRNLRISKERKKYRKLFQLSLMDFLTEVPGFIAVLWVALASESLIMWFDALDSGKNILNSAFLLILSHYLNKNLRYRFNYGTGKIEALGSVFTDVLMVIGLFITLGTSIRFFVHPEAPSENLLYAVLLKGFNVFTSCFFLWRQYRLKKMDSSRLIQSGFNRFVGNAIFDFSAFVGVLSCFLFRVAGFSWYISPALCLLFSVVFLVVCILHIKECVQEILDVTLSPQKQAQVIDIVQAHSDKFDRFAALESRRAGEKTYIDLYLTFGGETTYEQLSSLESSLSTEMNEVVPNADVRIVLNAEERQAQ